MAVLLGLIMIGLAKISAKQEENGSNNEKICLTTGIAVLALFDAMTAYFLYTDFQAVDNLSSMALDVNQLIFGLLGISMIILGNIMPKLRINSTIGLRTQWSMKNEITWKKSQRFGGISFMVGGLAVIVMCFFAKGIACFCGQCPFWRFLWQWMPVTPTFCPKNTKGLHHIAEKSFLPCCAICQNVV